MENYKVKVGSEAESKEVQGLFFELGGGWGNGRAVVENTKSECLFLTDSSCITHTPFVDNYFYKHEAKELTISQLKDMVVLKRNDVADATHGNLGGQKGYLTCENVEYFWNYFDKKWNKISLTFIGYGLKPITKEPVMKEYLDPENDYKFIVTDKPFFDWIEVPEGSDAYINIASGSGTSWFYKFGKNPCNWKNNAWNPVHDKYSSTRNFIVDGDFVLWQRETLNDKVASAEAARQSGVFVGAPFYDLPEFNFEAVDDFVESNVEQTLSDRESTYGSFKDVALTTRNLMNCIDVDSMNAVQQEALHMICSKLARITNGDPNHVDSWHDIAGYASLVVKDISENSSKD